MTVDALAHAHDRLLADLAEQLATADTATMARAIRAAEQHLADAGRTDATTIAAAVRAGTAAARCP